MLEENYQKETMNPSSLLKDARIISENAPRYFCLISLYQMALQSYYVAAAQALAEKYASVVYPVLELAANHKHDWMTCDDTSTR